MFTETQPSYYRKSGYEPLDFILNAPFALSNVFKYVWRFQDKEKSLLDLKKASEYLTKVEQNDSFFNSTLRFLTFRRQNKAFRKAMELLKSENNSLMNDLRVHTLEELYKVLCGSRLKDTLAREWLKELIEEVELYENS